MARRRQGDTLRVLKERLRDTLTRSGKIVASTQATIYEEAIVQELSQPGTGRIYFRGGIAHQASAPGEPPAADLGILRASVLSEPDPDGSWTVSVNAPYAVPLEYGAPEKGLLPRPFFRVACDKAKRIVDRLAKSGALQPQVRK